AMGRFDEAFVELRQAIRLDPVGLIVNTSLAGIFWLAREFDAAIEQSLRVIELDPHFIAGRWALARSLDSKGEHESAILCAQEAVRFSQGVPFYVGELGHALAGAGRKKEALDVATQLLETSSQRYVDACNLAHIYAGLGDKEKTLAMVEKAVEERASYVAYLNLDPWLDLVRGDERFQELLRRAFPQEPDRLKLMHQR